MAGPTSVCRSEHTEEADKSQLFSVPLLGVLGVGAGVPLFFLEYLPLMGQGRGAGRGSEPAGRLPCCVTLGWFLPFLSFRFSPGNQDPHLSLPLVTEKGKGGKGSAVLSCGGFYISRNALGLLLAQAARCRRGEGK
jgi:hypothetical protein